MFLLDTSVILPCLRRVSKDAYLNFLSALSEQEAPWISVITRLDVLSGTPKEFQDENVHFLDAFLQAEVSSAIAGEAGRLYYSLAAKGQKMEANDLLIGASSAVLGTVLVTANSKRFPYLRVHETREVEYQSKQKKVIHDTLYMMR